MARRIPGKSAKRPAEPSGTDFRPSREDILRYIEDNPDSAGKREIARAFNLKGPDRVWLKDVLRELEDEGLVGRGRKRLMRAGTLPPMAVLDIVGRDEDGGLIARPAEWAGDPAAVPTVSIRAPRGEKGPTPGIGDRALAKVFAAKEPGGPDYTGRIVRVFDRRAEAVLGVFRVMKDGSYRIEPVERRQPELVVDAEFRADAQHGDLVEVEPVKVGRYGLPRAKVLAVLGSLTGEKAVSMIAIHAHDIPHIFPGEVIEEAEALAPLPSPGSRGAGVREDWRSLPLVTIDPADAKDHDDAVHAEPDPDDRNPGGFVVTVAIADVAAYVRPGSALDREALRRGNSVYFPDRVVPMLPERISNDLCSLREGVDRPALAVRMTFAADGRKIRHAFHRVMMKSAAKLAYPQAQAAIDGRPDDKTVPILETVLRPLWAAYAVLKRGRDARQPLELDLPERKILLKPDGTVDRVVVPERLDAHRLIEEFMIQANVAAAETLENKRQALVFRIHDAPSLAKQESLREFLQTVGLSLARGAQLRPSQFNSILERVRGADNEALVNEVVLRSQSQAEYSPQNIGHFGLNLRRYAHFTSPIRRYSDLIVHRALIRALNLGSDGLTPGEEVRLEETAALISASERRAMAAERDTVDRLVAAYLAEKLEQTFDARVSGVTKSGLFVQLPQYGADGFVPVSSLGGDYYMFDEGARALVGERTGRGFQLADRVEVKLVEIAPLAGAMRFEMLTDPKPLPGSVRSHHKTKGARERARAARKGGRPHGRRR
ncbi:MAG: ribonuclease R [Rhizobiaceae bacterium]|nr:ribonuclease R [Rhizobiaceae bacterium]